MILYAFIRTVHLTRTRVLQARLCIFHFLILDYLAA